MRHSTLTLRPLSGKGLEVSVEGLVEEGSCLIGRRGASSGRGGATLRRVGLTKERRDLAVRVWGHIREVRASQPG